MYDTIIKIKIFMFWDFLGGPVAKNLPCNAEDRDLNPGQETKIPYAVGQLNTHS